MAALVIATLTIATGVVVTQGRAPRRGRGSRLDETQSKQNNGSEDSEPLPHGFRLSVDPIPKVMPEHSGHVLAGPSACPTRSENLPEIGPVPPQRDDDLAQSAFQRPPAVVRDAPRAMELLTMPPYSDLALAYVRSWLLDLFVDGTLPVNLLDWQSYDFSRSVIERRSHFFFRGLANDRAFFRALKTQQGALSEWDKPVALMAGMCLPSTSTRTGWPLRYISSPARLPRPTRRTRRG